MKKLIIAGATLVSLSIMSLAPAEARNGCGPHRYRANDGRCYWMQPVFPPPEPPAYYGYDGFTDSPTIPFGFGIGFGGAWGGGWHHGARRGWWPHEIHPWH